ncbi:MAG: GAF domain-containing protein, partial [Promethearchaeota archaeon]
MYKDNLDFKNQILIKDVLTDVQVLTDNLVEAFAIVKLFYDERQEPADLLLIETNPAFLKIANVENKADIVGKRASASIKFLHSLSSIILSRIKSLRSGKSASLGIFFFAELNKWLKISVFSPKNDFLVLLLLDLTRNKRLEEIRSMQLNAGMRSAEFKDIDAILKFYLDETLIHGFADAGATYLITEHDRLVLNYTKSIRVQHNDIFVSLSGNVEFFKIVIKGKNHYTKFKALHEICNKDYSMKDGLKAAAILPVFSEKRVIGCIVVGSSFFERFSADMINIFKTITTHAGHLIERTIYEHEMLESEARFHQLFDISPVPIMLFTIDGEFIDCNDATEKLINCSRFDLVTKTLNDLIVCGRPDQSIDIKSDLNQLVETRSILNKQILITSKKNKPIFLDVFFTIFKVQKQDYIQLVFYDISRLKHSESTLKQENIIFKERNGVRKDFIERAVHELKTPLISIYTSTELLLKMYGDRIDSEILDLLDMLSRGARKLKDQIDKIVMDMELMFQ